MILQHISLIINKNPGKNNNELLKIISDEIMNSKNKKPPEIRNLNKENSQKIFDIKEDCDLKIEYPKNDNSRKLFL